MIDVLSISVYLLLTPETRVWIEGVGRPINQVLHEWLSATGAIGIHYDKRSSQHYDGA